MDDLVPPYAAVDVVAETGSTNADLRAAALAGAADRTVLIAGRQSAGQGRRQRSWTSPAGTGLYCSVLLRPGVSPARLGTLTAVAGIAVLRAVRALGADVVLKWPNDVLLPGLGKAAGILAEVVGDGVVLGIGLNVGPLPDGVPAGVGNLAPASLAAAGVHTDVPAAARAVLTALDAVERPWRAADGDLAAAGLLAEYRAACDTLGRPVRVELVDGALEDTAADVDADGRLVLAGGRTVSAGDVVHLRGRS